jgi:uncharacterized coiled-coil DUF342 family protein
MRRNGNGHSDAKIIHEDIRAIDADLKECAAKMNDLTRAADGFKRSHETLKELAVEQAIHNRAFEQEFSVFMTKFGAHLDDFKCLGLRRRPD